jgi:pilus assembly protein Flp/PilA
MHQMTKRAATRLAEDRKGVTAIEYGLIAGAIAVAIIGAVVLLGSDINNLFTTTGSALATVSGK